MPLSDDVLRGLRWGAILLAGLAIGVAWYRLVRESPPKPTLETSAPAPVTPEEKSGSLPAEKPVDKPADKSVALIRGSRVTAGSRPVPPPPARTTKPFAANPRAASGDSVPTGEPASRNDDKSAGVDENPAEPFVELSDEKKLDRSAAGRADAAESPGPGALDENAPKQEARGKRWIKTVGRWLGIGRRDPSPH